LTHWHFVVRLALAWFTPLLEHQSPLFNDFETFFENFNAIFRDSGKKCTFNVKLQYFYQGSCSIVIDASEFKQLTCDISWGEITLICEFQFGL
jgi:hypothetical protein